MKKPSHIPFFPDAYLRDTTHLTTEEHGAYFLLLMAAWGTDDCSLPNDERRLAALVRMPVARWRKVAFNILEFWTIESGRIWQKRLRKEWAYVNAKRAKAKDAVEARWDKQKAYGRNTDAYTDVIHLGGGVGEGGGPYQGKSLVKGGSSAREDQNPFGVIEGGK
jgi:uncharacterized protein YdaU (DUF1376 family)